MEVKCNAQGFLERGNGHRSSQREDSFWFLVVEVFWSDVSTYISKPAQYISLTQQVVSQPLFHFSGVVEIMCKQA
jgi:hypothetical protein